MGGKENDSGKKCSSMTHRHDIRSLPRMCDVQNCSARVNHGPAHWRNSSVQFIYVVIGGVGSLVQHASCQTTVSEPPGINQHKNQYL